MSAASRRVVVLGGDAGGAAAVAPVVEILLRDQRLEVDAFAYAQADAVWKARGLPFAPFPEPLPDLTAWLRERTADLVLVGTSVNDRMCEAQLIHAARGLHVSSVAVLDFWSNYGRRFRLGDAEELTCPTRIAVMDEQAAHEMVAEGFPRELLVVTGQPAFDDIVPVPAPKKRDRSRSLTVLFLSQPLESFYSGRHGLDHPGFTEKTVLPSLVRALDDLADEHGVAIRLKVQPHPREEAGWLDSLPSRSVQVEVVRPEHPRALLGEVDLVAGMNTVLLMEACYMGIVVVSLQPGLRGPDLLPASRAGRCPAAYAEEEFKPVIASLLFDDALRGGWQSVVAGMKPMGGAARRVAEMLYDLLPEATGVVTRKSCQN